jgi:hypothetical protein
MKCGVMMKTQNCRIVELKECDVLYQATYNRVCDNCGYVDTKDRHFVNILKIGKTMDMDNWHCPHCHSLNITNIECD